LGRWKLGIDGTYLFLSGEDKPTRGDGVPTGAHGLELDTGKRFIFDGGSWIQRSELTVDVYLGDLMDLVATEATLDDIKKYTTMLSNASIIAGGDVVSATNNTLTAEAGSFEAETLTGDAVAIVRGPGSGQARAIISNTNDTLTLDRDWVQNPTSDSDFIVTRAIDAKVGQVKEVPENLHTILGRLYSLQRHLLYGKEADNFWNFGDWYIGSLDGNLPKEWEFFTLDENPQENDFYTEEKLGASGGVVLKAPNTEIIGEPIPEHKALVNHVGGAAKKEIYLKGKAPANMEESSRVNMCIFSSSETIGSESGYGITLELRRTTDTGGPRLEVLINIFKNGLADFEQIRTDNINEYFVDTDNRVLGNEYHVRLTKENKGEHDIELSLEFRDAEGKKIPEMSFDKLSVLEETDAEEGDLDDIRKGEYAGIVAADPGEGLENEWDIVSIGLDERAPADEYDTYNLLREIKDRLYSLETRLKGQKLAESKLSSDGGNETLNFAEEIKFVEIWISPDNEPKEFLVGGQTVYVAPGGWRSEVDGTDADVVVPEIAGKAIVNRLV